MALDKLERKGAEYDVKTVQWSQPDSSLAFPLMMIKMDADGNDVLDDAGWRGNYVLFANVDIGAMEFSNDPMKMAFTTEECRKFMFAVKTGGIDWEHIEDGDVIRPSLIDVLEDMGDTDGLHDEG